MPITRLSLDGYGAKRAGSFAGKEAAVEEEVVAAAAPVSGYTFKAGYIAPRRKKKKREEEPSRVEILVEKQEVKSVIYKQVETPSFQPIVRAVEAASRLIETRARNMEIRRKLEELEEEEDIIIILSQLQ
jgi:hypothetical protein